MVLNMKGNEEIVIVADDRERNSDVIDFLKELGAQVYIRRLEVGDYVVSDDTVFERKTANDFLSSIVDKRLFEQAIALKKVFPRCIIVVEGNIDRALTYREMTKRHVLGALGSLALMGISTVFTRDSAETAYLIYSVARKLQVKEKKRLIVPSTKMKKAKGGKTIREAQINLIASLPGISYELAERILDYFGCPRKFFTAHPYEWRKVKGLGDKRIQKLITILDTNYKTLDKEKEANLLKFLQEE